MKGGRRRRCKVLSKLETGCEGLCAVHLLPPSDGDPPAAGEGTGAGAGDCSARTGPPPAIGVPYSFTALMHGRVPDGWASETCGGGGGGSGTLTLPAERARLWMTLLPRAPIHCRHRLLGQLGQAVRRRLLRPREG